MPADAQLERELEAIDAALEGRPVAADLTEWGDLARALRDERPEIDPGFARGLDARAAAGFPREGRAGRWWSALAARSFAVPAVATSLLVALVVAGTLLSDGRSGIGGGSGDDAAVQSTDAPGDLGGAGGAGSVGGAGSGPVAAGGREGDTAAVGAESAPLPELSVPPSPGPGSPRSDSRRDRKVETSASMTLVAAPGEIEKVGDGIVRVTDSLDGFVASSSVSASENGGGGYFELRVPSGNLKRAVAELSRLAHVRERREATVDITRESVSARSRLRDAQADRRGLRRRLERAGSDAERERLRRALRIVTARIEAARADIARVDNRARFSTVAVTLAADPDAAGAEDDGVWTPGDAARDAWRVVEVAAGAALIALAVLIPLSLVVVPLALALRLAGRRRRERLLDAV